MDFCNAGSRESLKYYVQNVTFFTQQSFINLNFVSLFIFQQILCRFNSLRVLMGLMSEFI